MPYKTIQEEHGLLTKWWGHATTSELIQMQEQAHASPEFDRNRYSIHDFGECNHFDCFPGDIDFSAAIDGAASISNPKIKIAVVAANQVVFEMVNAYMGAGLSPYPLRFFPSMREARAWAISIPTDGVGTAQP